VSWRRPWACPEADRPTRSVISALQQQTEHVANLLNQSIQKNEEYSQQIQKLEKAKDSLEDSVSKEQNKNKLAEKS